MKSFREATAVTAQGDHYTALLDEQWSIGHKLQGGYLLAVLARAACRHAGEDHPHPTAVSGSFIRPPEPGPAEIHVTTLRSGRSITQVHTRLVQEDATCVEASIALGRLTESEPWWSSSREPALPAEQDCPRTPTMAPGGFSLALMEVVEQRLDPAHLGSLFGSPLRRGVIAGWHRLADGSDWDPFSLLVALDAFPPASYDVGLPGWAPTIQLTAYLRRLPAPGPVRVRTEAIDITADRMDETTLIWDGKGRLVAQAVQLAAVRTPK